MKETLRRRVSGWIWYGDWLTRPLVRLLKRRMTFYKREDVLLFRELELWQNDRDPEQPIIFDRDYAA